MPSKKELILIGGGGHCKACIDVIESEGKYKIAGIVDIESRIGQNVLGYKIIASDKDLEKLTRQYSHYLITIGQIKTAKLRLARYMALKKTKAKLPTIVSPKAHISKHAGLGEGTIVMHHAVVNANAQIGNNVIINTGAIIEHDAMVADHCHISTGAIINGESQIGQETFIGSLSVVSNNLVIVPNTIIGAGTVVVNKISQAGLYVGIPARRKS